MRETRLNGLAQLRAHREIAVDKNTVLDGSTKK